MYETYSLAELGAINKALLPKYSLEALSGGSHRFVRQPGLIGRRKGTGHIQGYPFKGKGPGGGIPGYQADSELTRLRNQYSAARAHRRG